MWMSNFIIGCVSYHIMISSMNAMGPQVTSIRIHYGFFISWSVPDPDPDPCGAALMYKTLLQRIKTSPNIPANCPLMYSSVLVSWRFMYASEDASSPWYSWPHLSLTRTDFPVRSARNGLGLTIMWLYVMNEWMSDGDMWETRVKTCVFPMSTIPLLLYRPTSIQFHSIPYHRIESKCRIPSRTKKSWER